MFLRILRKRLGVQSTLRDWVQPLQDIGNQDTIDIDKMPAIKLLNYYATVGDGTEVDFLIPELKQSLITGTLVDGMVYVIMCHKDSLLLHTFI